jgi:Ca2+-binding EF-hand superfamily protein
MAHGPCDMPHVIQVKEMMRQADKDGDGLVSFEEFKDIMCSKV